MGIKMDCFLFSESYTNPVKATVKPMSLGFFTPHFLQIYYPLLISLRYFFFNI